MQLLRHLRQQHLLQQLPPAADEEQLEVIDMATESDEAPSPHAPEAPQDRAVSIQQNPPLQLPISAPPAANDASAVASGLHSSLQAQNAPANVDNAPAEPIPGLPSCVVIKRAPAKAALQPQPQAPADHTAPAVSTTVPNVPRHAGSATLQAAQPQPQPSPSPVASGSVPASIGAATSAPPAHPSPQANVGLHAQSSAEGAAPGASVMAPQPVVASASQPVVSSGEGASRRTVTGGQHPRIASWQPSSALGSASHAYALGWGGGAYSSHEPAASSSWTVTSTWPQPQQAPGLQHPGWASHQQPLGMTAATSSHQALPQVADSSHPSSQQSYSRPSATAYDGSYQSSLGTGPNGLHLSAATGHSIQPHSSLLQDLPAAVADGRFGIDADDVAMAEQLYPEEFDSYMASDVDTADGPPSEDVDIVAHPN